MLVFEVLPRKQRQEGARHGNPLQHRHGMVEHEDRKQRADDFPDGRNQGGVKTAVELEAYDDEDLPNAGRDGEQQQDFPELRVVPKKAEGLRPLEDERGGGSEGEPEEVQNEEHREGVQVLQSQHPVLDRPGEAVAGQRHEAQHQAKSGVLPGHPRVGLEEVEDEDEKRYDAHGHVVVHRVRLLEDEQPSNQDGNHLGALDHDLRGHPDVLDGGVRGQHRDDVGNGRQEPQEHYPPVEHVKDRLTLLGGVLAPPVLQVHPKLHHPQEGAGRNQVGCEAEKRQENWEVELLFIQNREPHEQFLDVLEQDVAYAHYPKEEDCSTCLEQHRATQLPLYVVTTR
ncbi:minichromosome maintenance complex protein, putative [Babesia caballi]|uniref:Minichromosome maintenance complex protein, putative n=1 Tax=Babesia caballi TaxID=5871 RepID=A0AAV4LR40_BABCB|nr:minichromosome maintenance complex protein, putative [Babesia caballi]